MWIVLGVLAVIFVVAMCSGEKKPAPRLTHLVFVEPPAKTTGFADIFFGGLLICAGGYVVILLLPYLLGVIGVGIALAIAHHYFSGSK